MVCGLPVAMIRTGGRPCWMDEQACDWTSARGRRCGLWLLEWEVVEWVDGAADGAGDGERGL